MRYIDGFYILTIFHFLGEMGRDGGFQVTIEREKLIK